MEKFKLALLKNIAEQIENKIKKLEGKPAETPILPDEIQYAYHSLSPLGNEDPQGAYAQALRWALKNRRESDIKNIAITGTYGSGKSTILKTFQNHNTDPDFSFLSISLATFKEEIAGSTPMEKADLLRLIELSILQQLFYRETDETIPDSRFKKIKSFDQKKLRNLSVGLFTLILATAQLANRNIIEDISGYGLYDWFKITLTILSAIIAVPGYYYILSKSIRAISSITVNKLNINNAEIEISDKISKSILNNHLDEILYFFEVTDYTVVIIEDLDRFEQTEIFTKLRELNLLINSSKKINRDIVFVYAVRDDMFKDKDRTKFFDFIIPVIPVINSSNSNEKLMEIIKKNSYDIKQNLIENISLFIDDMRLLYNITNEYYIYHKKLGNLNQEKLMSMVVYKNIYPNDFVELSNGEGKLFGVFNKKDEFIKEKLKAIEEQIAGFSSEIKELDALLITDIQELRRIYVYKYIEKLNNITSFILNGTTYDLTKVTDEEVFKFFLSNNVSYNYYVNNYSNYYTPTNTPVPFTFAEVEKEVDPNRSYAERMKMLDEWNNEKMDELKTKITELESKKIEIRHYKIHDIIALGGCKMELENKKQLQLVNILLRNAYIDEDYLDYISIFYEGSITKEDREFLLNVKGQIASEYDYKLSKLNKLIPKIDLVDFAQHYILNYDLFDFLIAKVVFKPQRNAIFNLIKDESKTSIDFINGFIDNTTQLGPFLKELVKVWPGIWHYLSQKSEFPKERLQIYFKLILQYADVNDIKLIAEKSKIKAEISDMTDFLAIGLDNEKIKLIIKTLDIKFSQLDLSDGHEELAQFVYSNNHYLQNEKMVRIVINKYGKFDEEDFVNSNFYAIAESNCPELIDYIDKEIENYITILYLQLATNTEEKEEQLVDLLNHEKISLDKKKAIMDQVDTKVIDLENIKDSEVAEYLMETSKIVPKWDNIIYYYHWAEDELVESIISYINIPDNANILSVAKVDNKDNPKPDLETVKKFLRALILEESISNESYQLVLKSVPYYYETLAFQDLSKEKVKMLIEHSKLSLTVTNYDVLRSNFNDLHIILAEQKHVDFVQKLEEFVIEEPEVFKLLSSAKLTIPEKNTLISHIDESVITSSSRVSNLIGSLAINYDHIEISKEVLLHILSNSLTSEQRLQLLIKRFVTLKKDEIFNVLSGLPEPYSEIAVIGKRPLLDGHELNWDLAGKLVNHGIIKRATEEKGNIRISTFRQ